MRDNRETTLAVVTPTNVSGNENDRLLPDAVDVTSLWKTRMHSVTNTIKIHMVMQALISENARIVFEIMESWHAQPSLRAQETWIGFPIFGVSVSLTALAVVLNYRYAKKHSGEYLAAQDYMFSMLSNPFLFFIMELISGVENISIATFAATTFVCFIMTTAFFLKLASSDSSDQLITSLSDLDQQNFPIYLDASAWEKRINVVRVGKIAIFSAAACISTISREAYGKTQPLTWGQMVIVTTFFLFAGKAGQEITMHPKFSHGVIAFCRGLLEASALTYRSLSGLAFLIGVYSCNERIFCATDLQKTILTYFCFFSSLVIGLYTAATTRFHFADNHENNLKLIALPEKISAAFAEKKDNCHGAIRSCFKFFSEKWCDSTSTTDNATDTQSTAVVVAT